MSTDSKTAQEQLNQLFGGYRAEWLREQIYELFTEPSYLPEMVGPRPCMLVGGRGTGKTTVLKGMSYEGQYVLTGKQPSKIREWSFYGIYYRVNTNRVTAFRGSELTEEGWTPFFAHYLNLVLCDHVMSFLSWYQLKTGTVLEIPATQCKDISVSLSILPCESLRTLSEALAKARIAFEATINTVVDRGTVHLSMQGAPVDLLFSILSSHQEFAGKSFYFLIDEYENFEPYQQQIVNTMIKHSGGLYTFKIGVKELGIRRRTTLNPNEQLISPADYVLVNISDKLNEDQFRKFALDVCNERIKKLDLLGPRKNDIRELLPGLTEEEEATRLGAAEFTSDLIERLKSAAIPVDNLNLLQLCFIAMWGENDPLTEIETAKALLSPSKEWKERYDNYKHSSLYALRKGKRGIRRYYCGWDVFAYVAASNIRYFLELVDQSLLLHLKEEHSLNEPVSPEAQTTAAQAVGKKNLSELEGLAVSGAQLTKLLLGLGRVFGQMAADPVGHAPEVNQFHLTEGQNGHMEEARQLLESAVMHLVLLRNPGNKLNAPADIRDYDYMVHPIFSPFFVFSYRKKRKMKLSPSDLLGLIRSSRPTIREILARTQRQEGPLPDQMDIFEAYYYGTSE